MSVSPPFGPERLTGFELELVAPPGAARAALAEELAFGLGGRVAAFVAPQRSSAEDDGGALHFVELSWGLRIEAPDGRWLCSVVDDLSLNADLRAGLPRTGYRLLTGDPALIARAAEVRHPGPKPGRAELLAALGLSEEPAGAAGSKLHDASGKVVGALLPDTPERERVAELISAPLARDERAASWRRMVGAAGKLGFAPASDGGLHVHFDAGPWRRTERLARLIREWNDQRDALFAALEPNPASERYRGPFSEELRTIASGLPEGLPFEAFARMVLACEPSKLADVNLLGVVSGRARQPTLEVRCLKAELDVERTFQRLAVLESFLERVAAEADAEVAR